MYLFTGLGSGPDDAGEVYTAKIVGEHAGDHAGWSVDGGCDINGDGDYDVVIGAPDELPSGAAYVLYGPFSGDIDLVDADAKFAGSGTYALTGFSVECNGDHNADGYDDVLIGVPNDDTAGLGSGAAYVFFGGPAGG